VSHLRPELRQRAEELVALYPEPRSATVPLCHLAQEQDGYLCDDAMEEIAGLTNTTYAEVRGTASFYDLLHLTPVGTYVVGVCTNVACLLAGGLELLAHAEERLAVAVGGTTADGAFTLEETECLGDCDVAPCVQVNSRFVRTPTAAQLDALFDELRAGARDADVPHHGMLSRVRLTVGLEVPRDTVAKERVELAGRRDGASS
jgi:NADH-quinone oxidoreductase subunit E